MPLPSNFGSCIPGSFLTVMLSYIGSQLRYCTFVPLSSEKWEFFHIISQHGLLRRANYSRYNLLWTRHLYGFLFENRRIEQGRSPPYPPKADRSSGLLPYNLLCLNWKTILFRDGAGFRSWKPIVALPAGRREVTPFTGRDRGADCFCQTCDKVRRNPRGSTSLPVVSGEASLRICR